MRTITYNTVGTCSRQIIITIDDSETVQSVEFVGGCNGNTSGIASLVRGMKVENVVERLRGIECGMKGTSCPDQLARALEQSLKAGV